MMDFSQGAGQTTGSDLIPNGQLAWVVINVRGTKQSQSGGQYLDVELTIDDNQPFARRKVWEMIGDPMHSGNSEAYRQMGMVAISRILEAAKGAGPDNPAGYQLSDYSQLSGLRVPVRIGVAKGTGGYSDKNRVAEWLTPNPASQGGHKDYLLLMQGVHNKAQQPAMSGPGSVGGFTGATTLGTVGGSQPAFQQPQQAGASVTPAAAPMQPAPASPSNSWLNQANPK